MTYIHHKIAFVLLFLAAIASCKKPDLAGMNSTGEGLVPFALQTPSSGTTVVLNAATPAATVDFTWTASVPGLHTAPTYKWVASLKTGSLDTPLVSIPAGNNGSDTKLSLSYQRLDSALKAAGIANGAQTALQWSILADNGSTKLLAQNVYNITVTRMQDGASPFALLGPSSTTSSMVINPGSTADSLHFNWTRSTPAGGGTITYKVWFYKDDAGSTPVFSISSNNSGKDSVLSIAYAQFSDSLNAHGMTDVSQLSQLKWTVVAISGGWNQWSSYTNQLYVLREVDLFLAGSFQTPNIWDPPTGIQMIGDNRAGLQNRLYWIYIYLPANTEFKITQGRSWDINFGDGGSGVLEPNGNTNFKVSNAGVYRISADIVAKTYDISAGRMGFVGAAVTGVGWDPPSVFPTAQMHFVGTNQFMGVYNFAADQWKMIDGDHWNDGSNTPAEVRSYGSTNSSTLVVNADNMPNIPSADTYKVTWDASDLKNLKYTIMPWHMYLIGSATAGGWDNANAALPQLTYQGNGVWKITGVTLTGGQEFKFLMVKGTWDYNYGGTDPNTNAMAGGNISEGGGNIQVTTTGTYTVTIDEYNRTYKVQ
ncbi:MAG TPA: SusE domain-containing protein [Puia sp.]|nr:SusE domain-containing protein [Puia sp.]